MGCRVGLSRCLQLTERFSSRISRLLGLCLQIALDLQVRTLEFIRKREVPLEIGDLLLQLFLQLAGVLTPLQRLPLVVSTLVVALPHRLANLNQLLLQAILTRAQRLQLGLQLDSRLLKLVPLGLCVHSFFLKAAEILTELLTFLAVLARECDQLVVVELLRIEELPEYFLLVLSRYSRLLLELVYPRIFLFNLFPEVVDLHLESVLLGQEFKLLDLSLRLQRLFHFGLHLLAQRLLLTLKLCEVTNVRLLQVFDALRMVVANAAQLRGEHETFLLGGSAQRS